MCSSKDTLWCLSICLPSSKWDCKRVLIYVTLAAQNNLLPMNVCDPDIEPHQKAFKSAFQNRILPPSRNKDASPSKGYQKRRKTSQLTYITILLKIFVTCSDRFFSFFFWQVPMHSNSCPSGKSLHLLTLKERLQQRPSLAIKVSANPQILTTGSQMQLP